MFGAAERGLHRVAVVDEHRVLVVDRLQDVAALGGRSRRDDGAAN